MDIPRRIRAARELAGLRSADALVEALDTKGLGLDTLRAIEQGRREATDMELWKIAQVCGVPYEFFTVDNFAALSRGGMVDGHLERMEAKLDALLNNWRQLSEAAGQTATAAPPDLRPLFEGLKGLMALGADSRVGTRQSASAPQK